MGLKSVKVTIDGNPYTIQTLTGRESVRCFQYLVKTIAPALGTLAGAMSEKTGKLPKDAEGVKQRLMDQDIPGTVMALAAKDLVNRLGDDTIEYIMRLLAGTYNKENKCVGDDAVFDLEFSGNLGLLFKVLWKTLEANYGSFFDASGVIGRLWKASGTLMDQIETLEEEGGNSESTLD